MDWTLVQSTSLGRFLGTLGRSIDKNFGTAPGSFHCTLGSLGTLIRTPIGTLGTRFGMTIHTKNCTRCILRNQCTLGMNYSQNKKCSFRHTSPYTPSRVGIRYKLPCIHCKVGTRHTLRSPCCSSIDTLCRIHNFLGILHTQNKSSRSFHCNLHSLNMTNNSSHCMRNRILNTLLLMKRTLIRRRNCTLGSLQSRTIRTRCTLGTQNSRNTPTILGTQNTAPGNSIGTTHCKPLGIPIHLRSSAFPLIDLRNPLHPQVFQSHVS